MSFGPWMLTAFGVLAKFKFLRGTPLDPFGYTDERRTERQLIADYEELLDEIMAKLTPDNQQAAVGAGRHPGKNSRLRPGQTAPSCRRQGRRSRSARAIPQPARAVSQGGRII